METIPRKPGGAMMGGLNVGVEKTRSGGDGLTQGRVGCG